jgi:uncharacterized protein (DUF2267 family)
MKDRAFVEAVQAAAGLSSRKEAERWAKAVAAALADVAPDSETRRQFLAQLPGFLKADLQARRPRGLLMDQEALIQHVGAALDVHAPEARGAVLAVWRTIRQAVAAGELADFQARVPRDVAALLAAA